MTETYTIDRITDLLRVPLDRREQCVRELLQGLELHEFAWGEKAIDVEIGPMRWTDDGDMTVRMHDDSGPVLSLEVTEAITERDRLAAALEFISTADTGGELYPVGPDGIEYAEDGNTVARYCTPWHFLDGKGDTFLDAVEDAMRKAGQENQPRSKAS